MAVLQPTLIWHINSLQTANIVDSFPLLSLRFVTTNTCWNFTMSCMSLWLKSCRGSLLGLVLKLESSWLSFQDMFSLAELHIVPTVQAPPSPTWGFVSVLYTHCLQSHSHFISFFLAAASVVIHTATNISRGRALWQWTLPILLSYNSEEVPWCLGSLDSPWEGWAFLGPLLHFPLSQSCFGSGTPCLTLFLHLLPSKIIGQFGYEASPSQTSRMEVFCLD